MKQALKNVANFLFIALTSPLIILTRLIPGEKTFEFCAQLLSLVPGIFGVFARKCYLHYSITHCSLDTCISFATMFSQRDTEICDGVYIGTQCNIGMCKIGRNTLLGSGIHVLSGKKQHNFDRLDMPIQDQGGHFQKISIGEDCWIGNGAIVLADIGDQSIVAAGSVVVDAVPPRCIVAGNPAKIIKQRD